MSNNSNNTYKQNGWLYDPDGTKRHYMNGKLSNYHQPAEILPDGTMSYYKNGNLHRDDNMPALMASDGTIKYAINGKYHRDGNEPAVLMEVGEFRQQWWVNGILIKVADKHGTQIWVRRNVRDAQEIVVGTEHSDVIKENNIHREDGPAVIYKDDSVEWWLHGYKYENKTDWEEGVRFFK